MNGKLWLSVTIFGTIMIISKILKKKKKKNIKNKNFSFLILTENKLQKITTDNEIELVKKEINRCSEQCDTLAVRRNKLERYLIKLQNNHEGLLLMNLDAGPDIPGISAEEIDALGNIPGQSA